MMYQAYQAHADLMWPLRTAARLSLPMLMDPAYGAAGQATRRQVAAACRVLELGEVTHKRPAWNIASVIAEGRTFLQDAWWISVFPGLAIVYVGITFTVLGEGLDDFLRPKG